MSFEFFRGGPFPFRAGETPQRQNYGSVVFRKKAIFKVPVRFKPIDLALEN